MCSDIEHRIIYIAKYFYVHEIRVLYSFSSQAISCETIKINNSEVNN